MIKPQLKTEESQESKLTKNGQDPYEASTLACELAMKWNSECTSIESLKMLNRYAKYAEKTRKQSITSYADAQQTSSSEDGELKIANMTSDPDLCRRVLERRFPALELPENED